MYCKNGEHSLPNSKVIPVIQHKSKYVIKLACYKRILNLNEIQAGDVF